MRLPLLALVVLSASVPAARGQVSDEKPRTVYKTFDGEPLKKPGDEEREALLRKKLGHCKKTGDCKEYLLEKEKINKNKGKPIVSAVEAAASPVPSAPIPAASLVPGAVPDAPAPTADQTEVMRRDAGERRARTMSRAAGAADAMRRDFFPAEEAAARTDGAAERRASPATAGEPGVPELALAARTGYAVTFRDQGLKVGAGPRGEPAVQRADGTPASAADLERLRTALRAEPAALARRPDFFAVLPRAKFADLKGDFAARPELRSTVFKDIGMTAQARDFQWSVSCSGLSGSCNPLAAAGSYRKGQDVPPEDLDAIWSAAQEEILPDDEEFGEYTEEDRRLAAAEDLAAEKLGAGRRSAPTLASLLSRLGELGRSLGAGVSGSPAAAVPSPVEGGRVPEPEARRVYPAGGSAAAAPSAAPRRFGPPPAPEGRRAAAGRTGAYALAAAAAALLLQALRKRA